MLERNKYDTCKCLETGKRAELIFEYLCRGRGWLVKKAQKYEDINEHWDYHIEKGDLSLKVEVKAIKRIHRHDDNMQDQWTWIELHGKDVNLYH